MHTTIALRAFGFCARGTRGTCRILGRARVGLAERAGWKRAHATRKVCRFRYWRRALATCSCHAPHRVTGHANEYVCLRCSGPERPSLSGHPPSSSTIVRARMTEADSADAPSGAGRSSGSPSRSSCRLSCTGAGARRTSETAQGRVFMKRTRAGTIARRRRAWATGPFPHLSDHVLALHELGKARDTQRD